MDMRAAAHAAVAYGLWGYTALLSRGRSKVSGKTRPSRNMLLLAWQLPPLFSGGVYRPMSFLRYGPESGWKVSSISGHYSSARRTLAGNDLLQTIPESVVMTRVSGNSRLHPSWRLFPRIDGGFLLALTTARTAFQKFAHNPPSVVMASGPPFHNFVAAYYIARYFKAKLVLDYRDEWSLDPREFVRLGNRDRVWETRCLKQADAVTFTARGFLKLYVASFPELDEGKCHYLPNGWDSRELSKVRTRARKPGEPTPGRKYIISFVGRCGRFLSPELFLNTLADLLRDRPALGDRLTVRFVGFQGQAVQQEFENFRRLYPDVLELTGEVEKLDAIRLMMDSSCLLLLNDSGNKRFIPVKIYEYLASGPPLLVHGSGGEVDELVSRLKAGFVVPSGNPEALDTALAELMENKWQIQDRSDIENWLSRHTRQLLAQRLYNLLASVEKE